MYGIDSIFVKVLHLNREEWLVQDQQPRDEASPFASSSLRCVERLITGAPRRGSSGRGGVKTAVFTKGRTFLVSQGNVEACQYNGHSGQ